MAGTIRRVEDLIVKDREVQGKTETDWVGRSKVGLSNLRGGLVGRKGLVGGGLALVANGELGEVTVVVTLPGSKIKTRAIEDSHFNELTSCGRRP